MAVAEANQVIEMIKRIIADDTADIRERLQHLEHKTNGLGPIAGDQQPAFEASMAGPAMQDFSKANDELTERLDKIKALHRLDASPVQWTRDQTGKMVEAPEGLWEIACTACNHKTVWREGDKKPPQCKTWRLANGENVQ